MNLTSLVVVVLRLMALKLLFNSGFYLFSQVLYRTSEPIDYDINPRTQLWLTLAIYVFCAVALWVLALPIARLVTHGISRDLSFGSMSLVDCYTVAFMGVGLFYVVALLGQVLSSGQLILKSAGSGVAIADGEGPNRYELATTFIPFIAGVILFCKARAWATTLGNRDVAEENATAPRV
jgi:hypothetical protein